jgi:beta-N-acetylhexosaminidase
LAGAGNQAPAGLNRRQRTATLTGLVIVCLGSVLAGLFAVDRLAPQLRPTALRGTPQGQPRAESTPGRGPSAAVPPSPYPGGDHDRLDSLPPAPGQVDVARLAGQLVMAGMDGTQPDAELLRQAREGELDGVLLFSSNVSPALPGAMKALQQAAAQGGRPALLISTDQEGGTVKRLPGPPKSPQLMGSEADAEAQGAATATLLSGNHVNVDLAPIADVVSPGGFEASQGRGFTGGSERVGGLATAFARGLQRGGVAATAKHFPGIGSLAVSTDTAVGRLQPSPSELEDQLKPFRRLVDDRVAMVMLANAVCAAWDGERPAVFSPRVVEKLRQELGFGGVVITDDLGAPSLAGDAGTKAVQAVEAGADIVLFSSNADGKAAYRALVAAAQSGRLAPARLLESYRRVVALKATLVR